MVPRRRLVTLAAGTTVAAGAAVALAAPAPLAPPTVSGTPAYDSPLTCNPGAWNGAIGFGYEWIEPNGFVASEGQVFRPAARNIDRRYRCRVTAVDPAGARATAVSDEVTIAAPKLSVKLRTSSPRTGQMRVQVTVGPKGEALKDGSERAQIIVYRPIGKGRNVQHTIPGVTIPTSGKKTFTVKKLPPGKRTYTFVIRSADPSLYETAEIERKVTIKRKSSRRKR